MERWIEKLRGWEGMKSVGSTCVVKNWSLLMELTGFVGTSEERGWFAGRICIGLDGGGEAICKPGGSEFKWSCAKRTAPR